MTPQDSLQHVQDGVLADMETEVQPPSMFKVLLHNDDYTSQEFVVLILEAIFHKSEVEATRIMLQIHHHGVGIAGIYPYEIAETKVQKVLVLARQYEYPLQCTIEQE